jgi:hypothetical protein
VETQLQLMIIIIIINHRQLPVLTFTDRIIRIHRFKR